MITTCPACRAAETNPNTGEYFAACDGCLVRSIAKAPRPIREQAYARVLHHTQSMRDVRELQARVVAEHARLAGLLRAQQQEAAP